MGAHMAAPVRLNFKARRRPDLLLQFPEGDYTISGNLLVDDLGDLLQAEQAVLRLEDGEDDASFATAMKDAQEAILHLIRRSNPDAPDSLRMTVMEVMETIRHITGNASATQEVLQTLLQISGVGDTDTPAELEEKIAAEAASRLEGGAETPLPSKKRSRTRSSRSGQPSNGAASGSAPTGGEKSPGGSSKATAKLPVEA